MQFQFHNKHGKDEAREGRGEMTGKDKKLERENDILPLALFSLFLGVIFGGVVVYNIYTTALKGNVCGDVCMDSDQFQSMFDSLWAAKVKNHQCEFAFEILQSEFNIAGQLEQSNRTDMYQRYIAEFDDFERTLKEINDKYVLPNTRATG